MPRVSTVSRLRASPGRIDRAIDAPIGSAESKASGEPVLGRCFRRYKALKNRRGQPNKKPPNTTKNRRADKPPLAHSDPTYGRAGDMVTRLTPSASDNVPRSCWHRRNARITGHGIRRGRRARRIFFWTGRALRKSTGYAGRPVSLLWGDAVGGSPRFVGWCVVRS